MFGNGNGSGLDSLLGGLGSFGGYGSGGSQSPAQAQAVAMSQASSDRASLENAALTDQKNQQATALKKVENMFTYSSAVLKLSDHVQF